jgi:nucleoside-diphosphate-sugar epimerase
MQVLVTGGGGLIGARIVQRLLQEGASVVSLDSSAIQPRLDAFTTDSRLRRVGCDIRDYERLLTIMQGQRVERVIHMAALLSPITEDEPALGFSVNITGANNVFEASRHAGVQRVCYATSIATYGDQSDYGDVAVNEDSIRNPYNLYGHAKLINEETAKAYTRNFGLDTRGIRISAVFGHGRVTGRSSAISRIISAAAVGERAVSDVQAQQLAPVIYVVDVAECMVRTCFAENLELPVYVGPNTAITVEAAADIIRDLIPVAQIDYTDNAAAYSSITQVDGSRFVRDIGYQPPSIESRIRDQINEARVERQMAPLA